MIQRSLRSLKNTSFLGGQIFGQENPGQIRDRPLGLSSEFNKSFKPLQPPAPHKLDLKLNFDAKTLNDITSILKT